MIKNKLSQSVRLALTLGITASFGYSVSVIAEEAEQSEIQTIEKIQVTGSRIKRIDIEATQPITVIGSDYISERGLTNAATAVTDIPGVFSGATPNLDTNTEANGSGLGQNTIDIYGLGAQRTLTLVNGSRFVSSNSPVGGGSNPGSAVDVNNIPVGMIERVEVVKVGGAPVYGADAVAGVVNYILKDDYQGAEFSADYSSIPDSNAEETSFRGLMGGNFNNDKGNVVFSFEYNKTDNIAAKDVPSLRDGWGSYTPVGADAVSGADGEVPVSQVRLYSQPRAGILSFSGLTSPGPVAITNIGLGAWNDGGFWQFDPVGTGDLVPFDAGIKTGNTVWSSGGDGLDLVETNTAREGYERYNLSIFGNYAVTDDINFSVTAFANASDAANQGYQASRYSSGAFGGNEFSLMFNTDNPFLNSQARTKLEGFLGGPGEFYLQRGWTNLGQRAVKNESNVRSIKLGFDGVIELGDTEWDWELSYQKGVSTIYSQSSGISDFLFLAALDAGVNPETGQIDCKANYVADYHNQFTASGSGITGDKSILGAVGECSPIDPFGIVSQDAVDYVNYTAMGYSRLEQDIFQAFASGELFELPAGGVGMAIGYEQRTEYASYTQDGTGRLAFGNADASTEGEYTTKDIFMELHLPVVSSDMGIPLVYNLSSEMSYRRLDNSNAGKDDVWAVGLNYQPVTEVMIRANVSETVRAPAVTELFLPRVEITSFATDPCDRRNIGQGPDPQTREANCKAEGVPDEFVSIAGNASRNGYTGGDDSLKNEQAKSKNFGVLYTPSWAEGLELSVDWVNIEITDAIVNFSLTDIMEACYDSTSYPNDFCTMFKRDDNFQLPSIDAFESGYVNAALREFESIEYSANFKRLLSDYPLIGGLFSNDAGEFAIRSRFYQLKKNARSNTGSDFTDTTGQYNNPEWRSDFKFSYEMGDLYTYLDVNYHGEGVRNVESKEPLQYIDQNGNPYTKLDAITLYNLGGVYNITDTLAVRASVNNLMDWYPDAKELAVGRITYGRTFNVGVTAKF